MKFSENKGEITIFTVNNQLGENTSRISADIEGKDNDTVLNYQYLLDGLSNMESSEVSIELINNTSPCVLRPQIKEGDKEKQEYIYIIMPIKQ